jgi:hypothetical protein
MRSTMRWKMRVTMMLLLLTCSACAGAPEWEPCNASSTGKHAWDEHGTDCVCVMSPFNEFFWQCGGNRYGEAQEGK